MVDLINGLLKKAGLEDEAEGGQIRVFEVSGHKVHKELPRDHNVQSITDYVQLMAERIPQEELDNDRNAFIHAFHYHQEPSKAHGVPFKFHIKPVGHNHSIPTTSVSLIIYRMRSGLIPKFVSRSGLV